MIELSTPDLVLLSIALTMALAAVGGVVSSFSLWTALGAGSVPAGGSIGYALFCNPPEDSN